MVDPGLPAMGEGGQGEGGMTDAPADLPGGRRQGSGGEGIGPEFKINTVFRSANAPV